MLKSASDFVFTTVQSTTKNVISVESKIVYIRLYYVHAEIGLIQLWNETTTTLKKML